MPPAEQSSPILRAVCGAAEIGGRAVVPIGMVRAVVAVGLVVNEGVGGVGPFSGSWFERNTSPIATTTASVAAMAAAMVRTRVLLFGPSSSP